MPTLDPREVSNQLRSSADLSLQELHELEKPRSQVLWVLGACAKVGYREPISVGDALAILNELDVGLNESQVRDALRKSGRFVIRSEAHGRVAFRLSHDGAAWVEAQQSTRPIEVTYFEPGKRWQARRSLVDVIQSITGPLEVTDRYYGARSLEILSQFADRKEPVRFLTQEIGGRERASVLTGMAHDLTAEYHNLEIRIANTSTRLHDRYLLSRQALVLIGAGIKDLGSRESLLLVIAVGIASDTIESLRATFEQRWAEAVPI